MPGQNLTREEAAKRAELLSVASYDIALDLTRGEETFHSATTVRFSATARTWTRPRSTWTRGSSWVTSRLTTS